MFAAERGRNNQDTMPNVVSLAEYVADRRRAAKVRRNEAIAHVLRMQELIDQSERRLIASDRQLRRTSQQLGRMGLRRVRAERDPQGVGRHSRP